VYLGSVVQDGIDALRLVRQHSGLCGDMCTGKASYSPLLKEHSNSSQRDATQHGPRLEERSNSYKLQLDGRPSGAIGQVREVLGCRALLEH